MEAKTQMFETGRLVCTPGALDTVDPDEFVLFLARHSTGDWGDVCQDDVRENELSVRRGYRIISSYQSRSGARLWVITEADRSSTCVLLPEEY